MNSIIQEVFQNQSLGASSIPLVLFTIVMAFAVGVFIYWVYKKTYRGVMFSNNFALTLILMTVITAPVVVCIRNNVALSMGMVGALSIVRFRTAVKDPLDTGYMFWALTMGILLGAGQFLLAALSVVGIAAVIFILRTMLRKGEDSYLLVMRVNKAGEANAQKLMSKLRYQNLKNKTISGSGIELTYEVRVEKSEAFLNKLLTLEGVKEASLVSYSNETA
ncbi:MAG: DUF4956 domain-containing protein [Clostridia bacterium]|nr:DUF4956 domain-containing protein [Clostridia bacterium]MBR5009830.1 DUF4956 domain-containing protein [Clostridia bacterium]MBR5257968.1 DUF4956 domain-containing protein [Clostridia bacterium]MBR5986005.1 DUF4956 domain-containing protein [Clostridia bacterium]MBR6009200.1 DUF4956 domain-containing protein [Clostridia bacterium]